jgi:outer membrane protein assembly factor BamE (lipoprotein component of BamABCDE complex)
MLLTQKLLKLRHSFLPICLLFCLTTSACTPVKATRGNLLEQEQVSQVLLGEHHKADVMRILGTPTTKAIFDENKWYYVGMHTEQMAFLDPEVTEKKVLTVEFDENDIVSAVNTIDNEGYDVPISSRETPTSGKDLTVIQQILGNVGRFNTDGSIVE